MNHYPKTGSVGFNGMLLAAGADAQNGTALARSASTGALAWQSAPVPSFCPSGRGAVASVGGVSRIYFGDCRSDNGLAFDAATGALLWQTHLGSAGGDVKTPAVDAGRGLVYVTSSDEQVYALDATNGHIVWFFFAGAALQGSPRVSNGVVYVGSTAGKFFALDAGTGQQIWSFAAGANVNFKATAIVAGGLVYFSEYGSGTVYALHATTGGSPVWTFHPTFTASLSPLGLTLAGGLLYEAVDSHPPSAPQLNISVYAINASTGAYTWRWDGLAGGSLVEGDTSPPPLIVV
jgi:outer membrane protein assembly factor BamB